jgi:hypothetical protein
VYLAEGQFYRYKKFDFVIILILGILKKQVGMIIRKYPEFLEFIALILP